MRNIQRVLTLAGMTMAAGAVVGMGAQAASAATVPSEHSTVTQPRPGGHDNDRNGGDHGRPGPDGRWHGNWDGHRNGNWVQSWTVRTFQSKRACNVAGWIGEQRGAWDDSDCYRIGHSGRYVLVAHEYGGRHRR
jgi:hypothetical protein